MTKNTGKYKEFWLTSFSVDHPTSVLVLLAIILLAGLWSYVTVPKEATPDVTVPFVAVNTVYPGVAPEDIETLITRPIEEELNRISDLKTLTSSSVEGVSTITAEFDAGMDMTEALQQVREKVDIAKPELPSAAEEPQILEFNFADFPILQVNVAGEALHAKGRRDGVGRGQQQGVGSPVVAGRDDDTILPPVPGAHQSVNVLGLQQRQVRGQKEQSVAPLVPGKSRGLDNGLIQPPFLFPRNSRPVSPFNPILLQGQRAVAFGQCKNFRVPTDDEHPSQIRHREDNAQCTRKELAGQGVPFLARQRRGQPTFALVQGLGRDDNPQFLWLGHQSTATGEDWRLAAKARISWANRSFEGRSVITVSVTSAGRITASARAASAWSMTKPSSTSPK